MESSQPSTEAVERPALLYFSDNGNSRATREDLRGVLGDEFEIIEVVGGHTVEENPAYTPRLKVVSIVVDMGVVGRESREVLRGLKIRHPHAPVVYRGRSRELEVPAAAEDGPSHMAPPASGKMAGTVTEDITLVREAARVGRELAHELERNRVLIERLRQSNDAIERIFLREPGDFRRRQEQLEIRQGVLEKELDQARKIQLALLPRKLPVVDAFAIAAHYSPMDKVGGDLYGFVEFPSGDLGIFVADVSGHGIAAALIASMVKLQFDFTAPMISSPAETLDHLNDSLLDKTGGQFLTIFYAILRRNSQRLVFARAGHCGPYLYYKDRDEMVELKSTGRMLGLFPDLRVQDREVEFKPGDRLVLYTDGLVEACRTTGRARELYGEERFEESIRLSMGAPGGEAVTEILNRIEGFSGRNHFDDDVTLLVVDRLK